MEFLLEGLYGWAGSLFQTEVAKMTVAFIVAARLHRQWMLKDIKEQFQHLTDAINNVANSLSHGLELHSRRIDELTDRVNEIESNLNKVKED